MAIRANLSVCANQSHMVCQTPGKQTNSLNHISTSPTAVFTTNRFPKTQNYINGRSKRVSKHSLLYNAYQKTHAYTLFVAHMQKCKRHLVRYGCGSKPSKQKCPSHAKTKPRSHLESVRVVHVDHSTVAADGGEPLRRRRRRRPRRRHAARARAALENAKAWKGKQHARSKGWHTKI